MPTPFLRQELPQTGTRLKWQATISAGPDISEILGINQNSTFGELGAAYTSRLISGLGKLQTIAAVEHLEFLQTRTFVERYGFGPNPHEPFQIVPTSYSSSLKLDKVLLFNVGVAEQVFNFSPNNLLFQQLPFVIQVALPPGTNGRTITHYFIGCWFVDSHLSFSTTDADQRLVQSMNVKVTKTLTLDGTSASIDSVAGFASDVVGGVITSSASSQLLLDNFNLT